MNGFDTPAPPPAIALEPGIPASLWLVPGRAPADLAGLAELLAADGLPYPIESLTPAEALRRAETLGHAAILLLDGAEGAASCASRAASDWTRSIALTIDDAEGLAAVRAGAFDYVRRDSLARLPLALRRAVADIAARRRIDTLARTDALTGLANRTALAERIAQHSAAARRAGPRFGLLYLDLDNFKDINDTLGHLAGDQLLIAVAERLRKAVRDTDLVARLGGDEFAVLQAHVQDPADCGTLAVKLLAAMAAPFPLQGGERHITTSLGIALDAGGATPSDEMMQQADTALYRAKDEGRNRFCFFAPELDQAVRERVSLAEELRGALRDGGLELWYQPLVSQPDGRIVGLEALLRWNHAHRGRLMPASFLPTAEKSRLLPDINLFVLNQVCRQISAWREAGVPIVKMAINVSFGAQGSQEDFGRQVTRVLAAHAISPPLLDFEVAEATLTDPSQGLGIDLQRIQMLGVRLVADRFGHGTMALDRIGMVGFSQLKIAPRLVAGSASEGREWIIARSVMRLAAELGVSVVATGVETAEQLRLLVSAGCNVVQGYHLSPPVNAADAEAMLRAGFLHPDPGAPVQRGGPRTRAPGTVEPLPPAFADLSLLLERLPVAVCIFDAETGLIEQLNDAFVELFGYPPGRFQTIAAFWAHTIENAGQRAGIERVCALTGETVFTPGGHASDEAALLCSNGALRRVDIRPAACEHLRIIAFIDVTAFRTREEQLEILSSFDEMTSFLNRRTFMERAAREVRLAHDLHEPLSLIVFDLDKFKSINDVFGHVVGDRVLQVLPQAVRSWLRTADLVGRTGGEEFMIMLPGTTAEGAKLVAERVRTSMEQLSVQSLDGETVRFSASFGISALLPGEASADNLIIRADTALYRAKSRGGNVTRVRTGLPSA